MRAASTLYLSNNNNNNNIFEESMFSKPQKIKFLNNSKNSPFSFTNVCSLGGEKGLNLGIFFQKFKKSKNYISYYCGSCQGTNTTTTTTTTTGG